MRIAWIAAILADGVKACSPVIRQLGTLISHAQTVSHLA
jgi:hypothetical protein